MKKKPTKEENELFEDLTSGQVDNIFLMAIEVNGVETTCIMAYEEVPGEEGKIVFSPVAIIVNDEIAKNIKLPEGIDELKLPDLDNTDEDEDDLFGGLDRLN